MKKLLGLIFVIVIALFGFTACANGNAGGGGGSGAGGETSGDSGTTNPPAFANSEVLIAYFSCTDTTKGIAEKVHGQISSSDIYRITPAVPYTKVRCDFYRLSNLVGTGAEDNLYVFRKLRL